ncbi:hypothetical protein [Streptomyces asiaticus]|uniref:hypothetical protein n=1 Tax=Streptomyces asiaticus TaxID=114695 RepID=UPI0037F867C1
MSNDRTPVTGPFRVYIDPTPGGVTLDVSHMITALLRQLAQDAEEDPQGVLDDLRSIAELDRASRGSDSHAGHERDEQVQRLLDSIGGGELPVYGGQVLALADRLRVLGEPKAVPAQRAAEGGAAA